MLTKKIIGTIIILFNFAGIGYLLFVGITYFLNRRTEPKKPVRPHTRPTRQKAGSRPAKKPRKMLEDDDDLLKDMDLSDLDDIDLDDFE